MRTGTFHKSAAMGLALAAILLVSACGSKNATTAGNKYDLNFIDKMTAHQQQAVDWARQAEARATRTEIKDFARQIAQNNEREIGQMTNLRDQWFPNAQKPERNDTMRATETTRRMDTAAMRADTSRKARTMRSDTMAMRSDTARMSGAAYERDFLDRMIRNYQDGIAMAQEALTKAEHQELKDLARQIAETETKQVDQMKLWQGEKKTAK